MEEGFLSYDDLSIIEPDALMAMGDLGEETTNVIVEQAEERAEVAEAAAAEARRQKREQERLAEMAAEAGMKLAPVDEEGDEAQTTRKRLKKRDEESAESEPKTPRRTDADASTDEAMRTEVNGDSRRQTSNELEDAQLERSGGRS